jgi:precorrin-4/cobalt-precorrin-4 C11-methyltransferase
VPGPNPEPMKVFFIGAGPGAPDLITLRGAQILSRSPIVLYAGSLVSKEMLVHCRAGATIINTAHLNLEEQEAHYIAAQKKGLDVARLHSGDPSLYGAIAEQMRRLDRLGIAYEVVPGVSSFVAAAAVLATELTKPEIAQTVILTRSDGRASPMPEKESLKTLGVHKTTLCIFLSGARLPQVVADLLTNYGADTPVALIQKATWPQEKIHVGRLGALLDEVAPGDWELSTMMIVGDVLKRENAAESRLYAAEYSHRFRKGKNAV